MKVFTPYCIIVPLQYLDDWGDNIEQCPISNLSKYERPTKTGKSSGVASAKRAKKQRRRRR